MTYFRSFTFLELFGFLHFSVKTCSHLISESYPRIIPLTMGYPMVSKKYKTLGPSGRKSSPKLVYSKIMVFVKHFQTLAPSVGN